MSSASARILRSAFTVCMCGKNAIILRGFIQAYDTLTFIHTYISFVIHALSRTHSLTHSLTHSHHSGTWKVSEIHLILPPQTQNRTSWTSCPHCLAICSSCWRRHRLSPMSCSMSCVSMTWWVSACACAVCVCVCVCVCEAFPLSLSQLVCSLFSPGVRGFHNCFKLYFHLISPHFPFSHTVLQLHRAWRRSVHRPPSRHRVHLVSGHQQSGVLLYWALEPCCGSFFAVCLSVCALVSCFRVYTAQAAFFSVWLFPQTNNHKRQFIINQQSVERN